MERFISLSSFNSAWGSAAVAGEADDPAVGVVLPVIASPELDPCTCETVTAEISSVTGSFLMILTVGKRSFPCPDSRLS